MLVTGTKTQQYWIEPLCDVGHHDEYMCVSWLEEICVDLRWFGWKQWGDHVVVG